MMLLGVVQVVRVYGNIDEESGVIVMAFTCKIYLIRVLLPRNIHTHFCISPSCQVIIVVCYADSSRSRSPLCNSKGYSIISEIFTRILIKK